MKIFMLKIKSNRVYINNKTIDFLSIKIIF